MFLSAGEIVSLRWASQGAAAPRPDSRRWRLSPNGLRHFD